MGGLLSCVIDVKNKMCMKKIERHTTNTRKGGRNMTNRNGSKGAVIKGHQSPANLIRNLALNLKLVMIIKEKNIVLKGNQKGVK